MKIAIIAPIEETVPPQKYGGTEWITYHIANGMGKKGHDVHLFAAGNSPHNPHYSLIPSVEISIRSLPEYMDNMKLRDTKKLMILTPITKLVNEGNYDIVHNHISWRYLLYADFVKAPVLTTHHMPLIPDYQQLIFREHRKLPHVSISNNQRRDMPELNYIDTVYNGIDIALYPYSEQIPSADSHMAFLARMSREKGAVEAAQVAHKLKKRLKVAAKIDSNDKEYFEEFKQYIDNNLVTFQQELGQQDKNDFLQTARCLLVPIQWEEPFGLMFTEAMACGTPVITYARGSAPEIIRDGVTGYLVNQSEEYKKGDYIIKKTGAEGLYEAAERLYNMPPEQYGIMRLACRKHVEANFTVDKMVDKYEEVYKKIIPHAS